MQNERNAAAATIPTAAIALKFLSVDIRTSPRTEKIPHHVRNRF